MLETVRGVPPPKPAPMPMFVSPELTADDLEWVRAQAALAGVDVVQYEGDAQRARDRAVATGRRPKYLDYPDEPELPSWVTFERVAQ